jgi:predicted component of type VI protein secretion system
MSQERITIVEPTGVRRSMPLPPQGLTIGRGPDNQLVVDHEFISRNHARITVEEGECYVVDLNSSNGTYLGHTRLSPNTPALWPIGTPLHVGDVLIHLEKEGQRRPDTKERLRRQHERTEVVGWAPDVAAPAAQNRSNLLLWAAIAIGIVLLLAICIGLAAFAYFYF